MVIGRICLFIWYGLFILFIIIAYSNKKGSWITWTLKPPSAAPPVHTVTWQGSMRQLPSRHPPEVSAAGGPALSITCLHGAFPASQWERVRRKEKLQHWAMSLWDADAAAWGVSWMSAVMSLTLKACQLWDACWCREKGHGSGREAVQSPTWIKSLVFCQWAEWAVGGWFKDCELNFLGLGSWAASYTNYVEGVLEEERNGS